MVPVFAVTAILLVAGAGDALAAPKPLPGRTTLPLSVVSATCLNPTNDMKLDKWAYVNGYLECEASDENAEGNAVYRESPIGSGKFTLLVGTGGLLDLSTMIRHGVPPDTATALYNAMQAQSVGLPRPR